jgi:multicomponent Na+:H+ antiporter subunit B
VDARRWPIEALIDVSLLGMLVVVAVAVARQGDLVAASMLTGIYSLLSACWMIVLDAPDVAFTEAAVGAGVSTALMLATLGLVPRVEKGVSPRGGTARIVPLFVTLVFGGVLLVAVVDMPTYGDPSSPIHHHVAPHYLRQTEHEIHVPNVVTATLASYRGFDTLGETTVVLTACIGVLALLGGRRPPRRSP